jgi:hypothetical protein
LRRRFPVGLSVSVCKNAAGGPESYRVGLARSRLRGYPLEEQFENQDQYKTPEQKKKYQRNHQAGQPVEKNGELSWMWIFQIAAFLSGRLEIY